MKSKKKNSGTWKIFVLSCMVLWAFIFAFTTYILGRGGHLIPLAAETILAEGKVLDSEGKGIANAKIAIFKDNTNYIFADSQGAFAVRNGTEASYKVAISAGGYRQSDSTITFVDGNKSFYIYTLER